MDFKLLGTSLRALDLTDEKGPLCGRILGDLGVDVIKVEPPRGDPSRFVGPFFKNVAGPDRSLSWLAFNVNKRGITLNIECEQGRDLFKRLVAKADFVIESFEPGYLERLGLAYEQLAAINPRLILTSISPYGQSGPHSHYKTSDLVSIATGGQSYLLGDRDRPPVRVSCPQAYSVAGTHAAAGTLLAHWWREKSGGGQHVDVSIQASVILITQDATLFWDLTGTNVARAGRFRRRPDTGVQTPFIWPCRDGYIAFTIIGGALGASSLRALVAWMDSEGMADDILKSVDWVAFDWVTVTQERVDQLQERFSAFFVTKTKAELYQAALERRIMLAPACTAADILSNPQLAARGFWKELAYDDLGITLPYPGSFFRTSEGVPEVNRRAPRLGEHNTEIYTDEFGIDAEGISRLTNAGVI